MRFLAALLFMLTGLPASADPLPEANAVFPPVDMARVELGRLLFFDPILSGNKNLSCASCHHPRFGTSDGLSLGMGDGGIDLGPDRRPDPANPPEQRIGRNAPALFNLGASEFTSMFHDGRVQSDPSRPSGIRTPLGEDMVQGFDSILAAQAMFPVLSGDEMAGHYSENPVAKAVRQGLLSDPGGAWSILARRVADIPDYQTAFSGINGDRPVTFADIANMMAAFIAFEWRADASPFDTFLRDATPLSKPAMRGLALFYGKAGCSACHSGQFQTDHGFHAIAMPQIGPGKAARFETHNRDMGRFRVTGHPGDAYRFRTPSLRNVTLTAPYGHAGAYATLEAVVRHHLDPISHLHSYDPSQAVLAGPGFDSDLKLLANPDRVQAIASANELDPVMLSDDEVGDLLAFLESLTDPQSIAGRLGVPSQVPSGLPVDQ